MQILRAFYVLTVAALLMALMPHRAFAQVLPTGTPASASAAHPLPAELDVLTRWAEALRRRECTAQCFVLSSLELRGSVESAALGFRVEGSVLFDGLVAVPLFGHPARVRLEKVTENGRPAIVGFDGDRYVLHTRERRFVLEGTIVLDADRALSIPGPLVSLTADLERGRVVEGAHLTGIVDRTIHFDAGSADVSAEPTVFQLSRAIRVMRETSFEYRLVLRSGKDLGVVRLPLALGEQVLEVTGASSYRVEDAAVSLVTNGRSAEIVVSGSLPEQPTRTLSLDARSPYEWWLLESDPEHRIVTEGAVRQVDSAESPIRRTLPSARLFLAQRGERIDVRVQTLTAADALAAVVRDHHRHVVVTARGDVVSDETVFYENNGIDFLLLSPAGRPVFLSTDSTAERLMRRARDEKEPASESVELMIPLRKGSHTIRAQTVGEVALGMFGGRLVLPPSTYPLPTGRSSMTLGLPSHVVPVLLSGGDHVQAFVGAQHGIALLIAVVLASLWFAPWSARLAATVAMFGLVCVSPWLFFVFVGLVVCGYVVWLSERLLRGATRVLARLAWAMLIALVIGGALVSLPATSRHDVAPAGAVARSEQPMTAADDLQQQNSNVAPPMPQEKRSSSLAQTGNYLAQGATAGVLPGVMPVPLPLPSAAEHVSSSREMVTPERPFRPQLLYLTWWSLVPLLVLWVIAVVWTLRALWPRWCAVRDLLVARLRSGAADGTT